MNDSPPLRKDNAALLWLGLVLAIALAIAFLLPVTPQDYWWYLRVGRDMLSSGSLPRVDTMSYTQAGSPVVYFSWGAAVIFWLLHRLGGLTLTVLVRGLLICVALTLVWRLVRRQGASRVGAALILLLAALACSNNWSLRPQIFAYPLFCLSLYLLHLWQKGARRAAWWLPLIGLVWVNLHGSFVLLILLGGAALAFGQGDKRSLAGALVLTLLASLVNPQGAGSWTYLFTSLTSVSSQQYSQEWLPPVNVGWQMNIFFAWLLAFPLLIATSPRKLDRLEWAWFLGFGFLALWGERYVIWFIFILTVLSAALLAPWESKLLGQPKPGSASLNLALTLVFLLLPLATLPGVREFWWRQAPESTENTPLAATAWLAQNPQLQGPLWSEIGFSSYLEFALPERKTWLDTRFEVFPEEQWQQYRQISTAAWNWQALLDESGANLLMVSVQEQPQLLDALKDQSAWCEIYRDKVAFIYEHCTGR